MNRSLVVLLTLLSLGLGSVALVLHHRACVAEKALAELRNSQVSQPNGDSPKRARERRGTVPKGYVGTVPKG